MPLSALPPFLPRMFCMLTERRCTLVFPLISALTHDVPSPSSLHCQARLIDDVTGTLPPYDQFIALGPVSLCGMAAEQCSSNAVACIAQAICNT